MQLYKKVKELLVGRETELKSLISAMNAGKHILLEGPPGTSKSTMLRTVANEAGIPFYVIEGNIDLTPAKLIGHFNPARVMADNYKPEYFEAGPLTKAMEEGGLLYIEEFNRMPADVANVLITPMEEGELNIPRYKTVQAVKGFTVIASQNPYDDVGTTRVSRAFMDRISLIKVNYQTEEEEKSIVEKRTGCPHPQIVELAVRLTRRTREHAEIKLGASVRAAIDMVDIFMSLQDLEDDVNENLTTAALMALSNKIWLSETSSSTPEKIIKDILNTLRSHSVLRLEKLPQKTIEVDEVIQIPHNDAVNETPPEIEVKKKSV